jgi:hypothetical protein
VKAKRLDRKKLIQTRRLLRQEVKALEADLATKEANKRQLVDEIAATMQTLDEKRSQLAALEKEN